MAEKRPYAPRGAKPTGPRGPASGKSFGDKKPYAKREGSSSGTYEKREYKPRAEAGSYEKREYKPREGGDRPYTPRARPDGDRPARPYAKREGSTYEKREYKPREGGSSYEKREYKPRAAGDRPYTPRPRPDGDRPARPYAKREGSTYEKREYKPRGEAGSYEKREYKPREGGTYEKREYKPRAEGSSYGDRPARPYAKREGGSYEKREYKPREGGSSYEKREYKPREPREGGSYEKRDQNRTFQPREGSTFERKQYENRGDSKSARFSEKRSIKRDRNTTPEMLGMSDGWLIGYHAVLAALTAGRRKVRAVWLLSEAQGELATILAANPDWNVEIKAKPDFEKNFGDMVHQGVAALVGNLPQPSLPELLGTKPKLIVALDQITDPHNLGAIIRSCAAFGAQGVIVTEHRAAGLNATAAKVAAGAMEVIPVVEVTNLTQSLEMMKEAGFTTLGMAGEAETDINDANATGPICLVMGSEGEGLRRLTRETCDKLVKIAIAPAMESLNVSVATGVALSILTRK